MGRSIVEMKEYAVRHGLCGEYLGMWNAAESSEELMMLATDANGLPFLAEAFADEWAITESAAQRMFGGYINGNWQANHGGYTSEIWLGVRTGQRFVLRSTGTLVVNCDMELEVPDRRIRRVYISGRSNIRVMCVGTALILVYGKNAEVSVDGSGRCDVRYIEEYKWR